MTNQLIGLLVLPIVLVIFVFIARRIRRNVLQKREAQRLLDEERRQWIRYRVVFEDGSHAHCKRRRTPKDDLPFELPEYLLRPPSTSKQR